MHIDTITHRSRICILHITSIFFNAQELIGALGVTTYVFIIGKKTMLWIGMSINKTNFDKTNEHLIFLPIFFNIQDLIGALGDTTFISWGRVYKSQDHVMDWNVHLQDK